MNELINEQRDQIAQLTAERDALAAHLVAIQDAALKPRGKTRQQWIDNIKRNVLSITARDHLRQVRADAVIEFHHAWSQQDKVKSLSAFANQYAASILAGKE